MKSLHGRSRTSDPDSGCYDKVCPRPVFTELMMIRPFPLRPLSGGNQKNKVATYIKLAGEEIRWDVCISRVKTGKTSEICLCNKDFFQPSWWEVILFMIYRWNGLRVAFAVISITDDCRWSLRDTAPSQANRFCQLPSWSVHSCICISHPIDRSAVKVWSHEFSSSLSLSLSYRMSRAWPIP